MRDDGRGTRTALTSCPSPGGRGEIVLLPAGYPLGGHLLATLLRLHLTAEDVDLLLTAFSDEDAELRAQVRILHAGRVDRKAASRGFFHRDAKLAAIQG